MRPERAAGGGREAAIDAGLAARLQQRALRPGISDPAHGRTLAARLRRATPPTLADDVAHRYGSAALGGERPPIVHAAPSRPWGGAASVSRASAADPASAWLHPHSPAAASAPPVVRASERAAEPAFPRVRPLAAAPAIQRHADPAAAAAPVVVARRSAVEPPAAAGAPADPATTAAAVSPLRVSAAPTRLRRQLAAERAEAAPAAADLLRVRATRALPVVSGASTGGSHTAPPGLAGVASPSGAAGEQAASLPAPSATSISPAIVQRISAPGSTGAASADPDVSAPVIVQRIADSAPPGIDPPPAAVRRHAGRDAPPPGAPLAAAGQGTPMPLPRVPVTPGDAASVSGLTPAGSATARAAGRAGPRGTASARPARPVVAPRGGVAAGAVQRMVVPGFGGAAALVAQAGLAPGRSAGREGERRAPATATPPPGAPAAELPTMTAAEERTARAGETEAIAGQVYEILARRLEAERRQRGW